MYTRFFAVLLFIILFTISATLAYQLSSRDEVALAKLMLQRDTTIYDIPSNYPYIAILNGILRSNKFVRYTSEIPCNIIYTLETDAQEAEKFVKEIEQDEVPTIIKDLPQEIVDAFSDVVKTAVTLPTNAIEVARATVTDAVKIINNIESGVIVSNIEQISGEVISDIAPGWDYFTAGTVNYQPAGVCLFEDCVTSTPAYGPCIPAATLITTSTVPVTNSIISTSQIFITSVKPPTVPAGPAVATTSASDVSRSISSVSSTSIVAASSNLSIKTASTPFESKSLKLCVVYFLAVFGVAILL